MRELLPRDPALRRFRGLIDMGKTLDDPHVYITTVRENRHFSMRFLADKSYVCGQKSSHRCTTHATSALEHQLTVDADYEK